MKTSRSFDEACIEQQKGRPPLKGILKKSPTISSCSSAIYAEAAVDAPEATSQEWCQERPAYLLRNTTDHVLTVSGSNDVLTDKATQECVETQRHSSQHTDGGRACYISADDISDDISYDRYSTCYDTVDQSYESLRDHKAADFYSSSDVNARWSYPHYDLEDTYLRPLPTPPNHRRAPVNRKRTENPENNYIQVEEIQLRKKQQQQRPQQHLPQRPLSVPPISFYTDYAESTAVKNLSYQTLPSSKTPDVRLVPKTAYNLVDQMSESNMGSSRYLASALPRSRDPIRKPMGSHYCPYSCPVYQTVFVSEIGGIQTGNPSSGSRYDTSSGVGYDGRRHTYSSEADQTVEVSHIYATVTRSSSRASTSSYIYASFSWKASKDPDMSCLSGISPGVCSPDARSPPVPLKRFANAKQFAHFAHFSHPAHRPPLPSYEEVIESRIRYGHLRPLSWTETSTIQVAVSFHFYIWSIVAWLIVFDVVFLF